MPRPRGFAPARPLVFVAVVAVAVVAGRAAGAPLSVAAHYKRVVEAAIVAAMPVALVPLLESCSNGRK